MQLPALAIASSTLIALTISPTNVVAADIKPHELNCDIGPLKRSFGGNNWLVYGCSDQTSVVVVADAGNPAQPFYFIFSPEGSAYRLVGEGTGEKSATQPAFNQLSKLMPEEIRNLFEQARRVAKK